MRGILMTLAREGQRATPVSINEFGIGLQDTVKNIVQVQFAGARRITFPMPS